MPNYEHAGRTRHVDLMTGEDERIHVCAQPVARMRYQLRTVDDQQRIVGVHELRDGRARRPSDLAPADGAVLDNAEPTAVTRLLTTQVIQGLDERSRLIAYCVLADGMTHAEAALVTGVSERTIRNCLGRVLEHGRRKLGISLPEEV